ncbi:hypothetical protein HY624_01480 [Candidatus Uhrbacteria bacterium]|nr:hypothetical protein [Candidatus Uhrbacteria bacterium]
MDITELKKKVLSYTWEYWAARPFGAFIMSIFREGNTRPFMRRVGVDAEFPVTLFQKGAFYKSEKVFDDFSAQLARNIKRGVTVFDIVRSCEEFHVRERKHIEELLKKKMDPIHKLRELHDICALLFSYVWITHGLEHLYLGQLQNEAPRYTRGDVAKFIGDISFPIKKNAHAYFLEALASRASLASIQKQFAWIKVRDGFSAGFTLEELGVERAKIRKQGRSHAVPHVRIPTGLKNLAAIAQELVYFRTLRTDILYEFLFLARPILKSVAKKYGIPFLELRNYAIQDLIAGKPKAYPPAVCVISYGKEFAILDAPLVDDSLGAVRELKGVIAFKGVVRGIAKIVKVAHEIGKVQEGDIIIAPTTAPSFIFGMKRAAAFVTEEGGITSHAAIVAREMKKPCIIGTKIATRVFKDGDRVEVDAERGIIRRI